ncbi:uncharacterized protein RHOBADRAFT_51863 [Rhodotorula graminis WP1]|uniref:Uncharacterized protein n=1 Tax=Rhodotorula graminis (strain WP1) TaxID=578459 RepID=A0A194S821_RHOGW|nr:uncharacterized protein RHOBADRAFT_51863 [Rhodotorula graminis WP1]KPV76878.1 hypothetical protein RHOBADRAFT_51863 [Rhodotorula graminis WP1]
MLPFGRPAVVHLTADSPSPLTYEHGLSPRHTLRVHDVEGAGREWVVDATSSKVSIFNSSDLTLRLAGRIVTSTVEVWASRNLTLVVGAPSPVPPSTTTADDPLGTLQLDPELHDVRVRFSSPTSIGKIVLAPLLTEDAAGHRSFGFSQLSFQAGDDEPFVLVDDEGRFNDPRDLDAVRSPLDNEQHLARQLVLSHVDGRWKLEGLARGEKDYPVLS